jgi:hypothetical protein
MSVDMFNVLSSLSAGVIRNWGFAANGDVIDFVGGGINTAARRLDTVLVNPPTSEVFKGVVGVFTSTPFIVMIPVCLPKYNTGPGPYRQGNDWTGLVCRADVISVAGFKVDCRNFNSDESGSSSTGRGGWCVWLALGN